MEKRTNCERKWELDVSVGSRLGGSRRENKELWENNIKFFTDANLRLPPQHRHIDHNNQVFTAWKGKATLL